MPIQSGYLLPGAQLLRGDDSGYFETYKGVVETATGKIGAYVKLLHQKALANELVCTVLCQAVGLPIPDGRIVEVSRQDYPDSPFLNSQNLHSALAFASEDVNSPSLARQFGADDEEAFNALLSTWSRWSEALLFDEWVANVDRNPGNFLVQGPDNVWLIDHTHAFNGPNWHANDLAPGSNTKNLIAQNAMRKLKLPERQQLLNLVDRLALDYENLAVKHLVEASYASHFLSQTDLGAVCQFLTLRVKSLPVLVSKHVGIPRFPAMSGA